MDEALKRRLWRRARGRCEYCQMPHEFDDAPFEIDHIISQKHEGITSAANLSLSCFYCNSFKGPNTAGIEKKSGRLKPLFNPRRQVWSRHFRWVGPYLVGRTDRKSTRLNSSHRCISYAVFCL